MDTATLSPPAAATPFATALPADPAGPARGRAFSTVLLVEVWERFGYYGVTGLLLLFAVERLGLPDRRANLLVGAFSALVYATPAIGGWLGDRVLGSRRCVAVGALVLACGYALLSLPGGHTLLFAALATVIVGNGLFKPNAANLIRRLFDGDDAGLDGAFTLYYMAVNVGSTVALLLCPALRDRYGFHTAFAVCAAGLALGLGQFLLRRRLLGRAGTVPDERPLPPMHAGLVAVAALGTAVVAAFVLQDEELARLAVFAAAAAIAIAWAVMLRRSAPAERHGLVILYLLVLEVMLFFVFYQQMATSLTLFAARAVDLRCFVGPVLLFRWSPAQFQALDPLVIMAASPLLALVYGRLGRQGRDLHIATKFLVGFVLTAAAFGVWWLAASAARGPVSSWVMVAGYALLATGELLVSGLGLAVIARYAPVRFSGFTMGSYFVAVGIAMYVGSVIANGAAILPGAVGGSPLAIYAALFARLFAFGCAASLVSAILVPAVRALERARSRAGRLDTAA